LTQKYRRYTQFGGYKLILEKIVKFHPVIYKIAFLIKQKFLGNLFAEEDLKGINNLNIDPKSVCIDVGANTGQSIEYFKSKFKSIHAFEPNVENYRYLKKKYKNYKYIKLYNFALGKKNEIKNLYIPYWKNFICLHQSASLIKQECFNSLKEFLSINKSDLNIKTSKVKVTKLNNFKIKNVSLIKIDSEGYEKEVLMGMTHYLKKDISIILENTLSSFKFSKKFLKRYGFECYSFQNKNFTKKNLNKSLNLFFLKKYENKQIVKNS
tara:strand:- start:533 stop:1330 length:798 start_codon:yes stop_codon:yes gene_type:complete